jgi:pyridoxal phosphate enzyme (YggS family)
MSGFSFSSVKDNYHQTLERISQAAKTAGRNPEEVRLVVVTKTQPIELVAAVVEAGAKYLGENYAEQALPKILSLSATAQVEWHMIGHVQSRKASLVCQHFDFLHSLDSLRLAIRLDRLAAEQGRELPVLLEFNLGGEESKFGWQIEQERDWQMTLPDLAQVLELPHLAVKGLMGMAPLTENPEDARYFYRKLRSFQSTLQTRLPQRGWSELSMGMSADFEVAIQEGATWVRIGQSIFGPRRAGSSSEKT